MSVVMHTLSTGVLPRSSAGEGSGRDEDTMYSFLTQVAHPSAMWAAASSPQPPQDCLEKAIISHKLHINTPIYDGKSESKVPYFIATKYLHIVRCLFIHLLHFTSLIFPHSHLLCWDICLGGKSISQNPVDRRWDPDHAAMFAPQAWHHHVIWIAWPEDVSFMLGKRWKSEGARSGL